MILGDFFRFPDRAGDTPAAQKTAAEAARLRKVRRFMLIVPISTVISRLAYHEAVISLQLRQFSSFHGSDSNKIRSAQMEVNYNRILWAFTQSLTKTDKYGTVI